MSGRIAGEIAHDRRDQAHCDVRFHPKNLAFTEPLDDLGLCGVCRSGAVEHLSKGAEVGRLSRTRRRGGRTGAGVTNDDPADYKDGDQDTGHQKEATTTTISINAAMFGLPLLVSLP